MIYCPHCGTPNKPNSKFCKNCAALLQPSTDIRCPICGTMNPQDAATCKSCGTRLLTSAAGTSASDKLSPADSPENIAPFNPPDLSQDSDAPAEPPHAAGSRPFFGRSGARANSEWLRRVGKTPPPEPSSNPSQLPAAETPASIPPVSNNEPPDWLRDLQAEANRQSADQNAAPEQPKPQISEIKLTGDDYDYGDIGGQVTDEMKAELEASRVESVEDQVELARRLLGLSVGAGVAAAAAKSGEPAQAASSEAVAPLVQETVAESETPAVAAQEPVAEIETPAMVAQEPVAETETSGVAEMIAPAAAAAVVPQISEIKLTGDDYDYGDIGGQVTDEMKAELEASRVESVEDQVELARRLLGLSVGAGVAAAAAKSGEPAQAASTEAVAPLVQETVAESETLAMAQAATPSAQLETPAAESQEPVAETETSGVAEMIAPTVAAAVVPQISEIKLTGDDYDYGDIGGQVTDEMKAELEASRVESVEDQVELARRLLGLSVGAGVAATAAKPAEPAPAEAIDETFASAVEQAVAEIEPPAIVVQEPVAEMETPATVQAATPSAQLETPAAESQEPVTETETSGIAEMIAPAAAAAVVPQISEIKLTGDDYDYGDIGGQVTDEMKAELEASRVESVEDQVELARRLLGLSVGAGVAAAAAKSGEPAQAVSTEAVAPFVQETVAESETPAMVAQEPVAEMETPATVQAATPSAQLETPAAESQEAESSEWLTKLAAASSAAVAAKVLGDVAQEGDKDTVKTGPSLESGEPALTEAPGTAVPVAQESSLVEETLPEISGTPEKTGPALPGGEVPEWLREFAPPEVLDADVGEIPEGEMPSWVKDLAPGAAAVGATALLSRLPDLDETERGDLPEWLREPLAPEQPQVAAEPQAQAQPQDETPIELPLWMRTGTPAGTRDPFEVVETTGPLAGVSGILPLAVALTEPHTLTPPTPARSEGGRVFQTLLAEPLAPAARVEPKERSKNFFTTQHLLYLLIFGVALLALFLPAGLDELGLLGKDVVNSPSAVFNDQLTALPANSTVLMAFEYSPGQSPELEPAAHAIAENLAARNVKVIALSSNPNGAAIAQSVLDRTREAHPGFTFVNLGYIPGREAGLRTLASDWLPTTFSDVTGTQWGQSPFYTSIRSMDDLALNILLLGDNPSLELWMTQVQPNVKSPLIAVTTAAIDTQTRVFVDSKQLSASLRGLTGAAELELWSGQSGRAVKTVNALSFVSLLLAGIIIVANVLWLTRREKTKK